MDPLAEISRRFSPYSYGFCNPLNVIDPDGMAGRKIRDLEGELHEIGEEELVNVYTASEGEANRGEEEKKKNAVAPVIPNLPRPTVNPPSPLTPTPWGIFAFLMSILQGDVSNTQKTEIISSNQKRSQQFVTIFKAPQTSTIAIQLESVGFLPENFPRQLPYQDGNAYFAGPKSRELAMEYAKIYGAGILQVTIPKNIYQSIFKSLERSYQGTRMTELPVPRELFPLLNTFPRKLTPY